MPGAGRLALPAIQPLQLLTGEIGEIVGEAGPRSYQRKRD